MTFYTQTSTSTPSHPPKAVTPRATGGSQCSNRERKALTLRIRVGTIQRTVDRKKKHDGFIVKKQVELGTLSPKPAIGSHGPAVEALPQLEKSYHGKRQELRQ